MVATSDLPGGVVNILTGQRKELVATFATHTHIRGLDAVVPAADKKERALGAADSAQSVYEIRNFIEFKTTWHPIGA